MASGVLERRNQRARARGWSSYGQQRYWLARFGSDKAQQARTALQLAQRIDSSNQPGRNGVGEWVDGQFVGSYFSYWTRDRVNDPDHNPDRPGHAGQHREGDWRARLVRLAVTRG